MKKFVENQKIILIHNILYYNGREPEFWKIFPRSGLIIHGEKPRKSYKKKKKATWLIKMT